MLYFVAGKRLRNIVLLLASLFFYSWGEGFYVILMLGSIVINYCIGIFLEKTKSKKRRGRTLAFGVTINLLLLCIFKYANWLAEIIAGIFPGLESSDLLAVPVHLPIGISFFTFQALSYIIDVYRNETAPQKNPFHLGLYIASFPQLIAGPIVRYNQVARQIVQRQHTIALFASGIERFIFGLSKKVLIANQMALMADRIFAQNYEHLSPGIAWLGIACYTLQIYFDFSGYSDMAIGLGRMFGFKFSENFNYPYIARSIQDFWKRWHISLSTWFRDYLYIPLGGNQHGEGKTYRNLFIVFLLCGLWHGASWNFIIWGLIHGSFLALERKVLKNLIKTWPRIICHCYTLFIVVNAWVFFRIEDLSDAFEYLKVMYFLSGNLDMPFNLTIDNSLSRLFYLALFFGIVFCLPLVQSIKAQMVFSENSRLISSIAGMTKILMLLFLFYLCISFLAVNSYNPFIYFRF